MSRILLRISKPSSRRLVRFNSDSVTESVASQVKDVAEQPKPPKQKEKPMSIAMKVSYMLCTKTIQGAPLTFFRDTVDIGYKPRIIRLFNKPSVSQDILLNKLT